MIRRNVYKYFGYILIMGASEALAFLDVLRKHGLLSRRTVAHYVLGSLYAGPEVREGTPAYQAIEESVCHEAFDEMLGKRRPNSGIDDEPLSWETGDYLRRVIATICDRKHGLSHFDGEFNGYSEGAYEEVRDLLGDRGRRYLGISGRSKRLNPSEHMRRVIIFDESVDTEPGTSGAVNEDITDGPFGSHPGDDWNPHYPELEPFPGGIGPGERDYKTASQKEIFLD
jgi:hypothetical protein